MKSRATKGINVPLLRKIQRRILAQPKRFYMENWIVANPSYAAPCGTAGCIAGWALILTAKPTVKLNNRNTNDIARCTIRKVQDFAYKENISSYTAFEANGKKVLGLSDDQAKVLFYTEGWPKQFEQPYEEARRRINNGEGKAKDWAIMAKAGADRIAHFIKTKGEE